MKSQLSTAFQSISLRIKHSVKCWCMSECDSPWMWPFALNTHRTYSYHTLTFSFPHSLSCSLFCLLSLRTSASSRCSTAIAMALPWYIMNSWLSENRQYKSRVWCAVVVVLLVFVYIRYCCVISSLFFKFCFSLALFYNTVHIYLRFYIYTMIFSNRNTYIMSRIHDGMHGVLCMVCMVFVIECVCFI